MIDHVNIVVSDLDRSARFYCEFLALKRGFTVTLEGEWVERVTGLDGARALCLFLEPDGGGTRLELLHYLDPEADALAANARPNTPGLRHVRSTSRTGRRSTRCANGCAPPGCL